MAGVARAKAWFTEAGFCLLWDTKIICPAPLRVPGGRVTGKQILCFGEGYLPDTLFPGGKLYQVHCQSRTTHGGKHKVFSVNSPALTCQNVPAFPLLNRFKSVTNRLKVTRVGLKSAKISWKGKLAFRSYQDLPKLSSDDFSCIDNSNRVETRLFEASDWGSVRRKSVCIYIYAHIYRYIYIHMIKKASARIVLTKA